MNPAASDLGAPDFDGGSAGPRWGAADIAPPIVLALFSIVLLALPYRQHLPGLPPFEIAAVAALATTIPLLLRRRFAELCLLAVGLTYTWYVNLQTQQLSGPALALWVALFSVGAHGRTRWRTPIRLIVGLIVVGTVAWHVLAAGDELGPDVWLVLVASVSYNAFLYGATWLVGDWFRERELFERELAIRARQLERDRFERERRVVRDERVRIARELHDVVAHHVSVMGIQAGAARTVLPDSPARATELLASIEDASRRAVDEMRRLLSALRDEPTGPTADRLPNLAQLDGLIESARKTGLDASLEVHGPARTDLPQTLDLSAYRIIQEALTNVIRHARARTVRVVLAYSSAAVDIRVEDDGQGQMASGGGGRGLVGMRERAALFGGSLAAGPKDEGGFVVVAHLPVPV